jgi:hypothetical protein
MFRNDAKDHASGKFWRDERPGGLLVNPPPTAEWLNTIQEELAEIVVGLGGKLEKSDDKQIASAIKAEFAKLKSDLDSTRSELNAANALLKEAINSINELRKITEENKNNLIRDIELSKGKAYVELVAEAKRLEDDRKHWTKDTYENKIPHAIGELNQSLLKEKDQAHKELHEFENHLGIHEINSSIRKMDKKIEDHFHTVTFEKEGPYNFTIERKTSKGIVNK